MDGFILVDKQLADVILDRIPLWVKGFVRKSGEPSERLHGETDLAHLHCFKYIVLLDVFFKGFSMQTQQPSSNKLWRVTYRKIGR